MTNEQDLHQPGAIATVQYIAGLRECGELALTGRLPTERRLSELVGCSRSEVRRGLAQLEAAGRITRHVGRGTFLNERIEQTLVVGGTSPADLMVVRLRWEPQVVDLAALNANQDDFAEMHRCLAGGDRATVYEEFESWDIALHRSFATATHNNVVVQIVNILHSSRNDPLWGGMKRRSFNPETCMEYQGQHRAIVEALTDRDRDSAQTAMTTHLETIRNRLLDY